ncbi:MAG: hypothetical protein IPG78_11630 [Ignavibacteria bacterium]|nr:hypothetical protein [Ignavibacteria bacterium]
MKNITKDIEIPQMEINSVEDIIKINSIIIYKSLKNESDTKICNTIGKLLKLQLKCIKLNSIDTRLSNIEKIYDIKNKEKSNK